MRAGSPPESRPSGVFEDVRQPRVVGRRRGERDGETVLRVLAQQVQQTGAALDVVESERRGAQPWQRRDGLHAEAVELLAGWERLGGGVHRRHS